MEQCSRECAKSIIDIYEENLDEAIQMIRKNFHDMDLHNSSIGYDIAHIVEVMIAECEELKRYVNNIHIW